jgi:UTP--glucose-1-phosphate uridylyltransferase
MLKPVRKAVFPVAGLGTRFLPATKSIPKEMLPLVDKPLIQHAVEEAREAGIEDIIFVTSQGKSAIEDHFDINGDLNKVLEARGKKDALAAVRATELGSGRLFYTRQQEPLGLGHAVWCARELVGNEPFAILLPDDVVLADTPCLKQMVDAYDQVGGNIVAVVDVPREHTDRYGILDVSSDDGRLVAATGLVEKPKPANAPSTVSIIGRYILQPEIFAHLDRQERGAGNEIQLTDGMVKLAEAQAFAAYRFRGDTYDCGAKDGFILANVAFALERGDIRPIVEGPLKTLLQGLK